MSWLYLPEQVEGCLGESSVVSRQSAMSNGTVTASRCSRRELQTVSSRIPQSGMTSGHSTGNPGLDMWILSLGGSPASHLARLEKGWQKMIQGTCGLTPFALLGKLDQGGVCWRTFGGFSLRDTLGKYSQIWSMQGMTLGGHAFRLPSLEHLIGEREYGLLPTPIVFDKRTMFTEKNIVAHLYGKHQISLSKSIVIEELLNEIDIDYSSISRFMWSNRLSKLKSCGINTWNINIENITNYIQKRISTDPKIKKWTVDPEYMEWVMGWLSDITSLNKITINDFNIWYKKSLDGSSWNMVYQGEKIIKKPDKGILMRIQSIGNGQVPQNILTIIRLLESGIIMDRVSRENRSKIMRAIQGKNTGPEMLVVKKLKEMGLIGFTLNEKALPGSPDIAFMDRKLAIFVDGCFWHGCPIHYRKPKSNKKYWSSKIKDNNIRDRRNENDLRNIGWSFIRLWECTIYSNPNKCAEAIKERLEQ